MNQPDLPQKPESPARPALSLPPLRTSAWVVETHPTEAAAWLASLPLTDSVQAAQQIYQALFTLNRMSLKADDRLMLMELYRMPVAAVASGLQPHFSRLSLPLRPRLKQLADFLCQLHMEMAHGYKHVLKAGLDERKPWESDTFLLALERAIRYLGEVLLRSYQVYMPSPPGVWKEVHGLYRYAELHGQEHRLLVIDGLEEGTTVTRAYLQALLLGLCGPYQLPQNECHQVNAFLARWGQKAGISSAIQTVDPVGHFLIDFDADHPAVPFPRDVPLYPAPALRALNAIELARVVHDFTKRLQKGESPRVLGLGFECVGTVCVDTLKRMLRFWGLAGRRQFSRRHSLQPLSLCVGLNAIHFFCDGQRPFKPPQAPAAIPERAMEPPDRLALEAESHDERPLTAPLPELFRVDSRWQVRDESAGGLSLARSGDAGVPIRVGDVLGIQNPALNQWRIGVVRWVKSADTRHVEMGVEMLAPYAQPLAVRPAGTDAVPYSQALLLPPIAALHQPATLLVARGTCRPGEDIDMADGESSPRRVRVLKVVERSGAFAQIVFADVARSE
jgi:cyclic-di-GMP-binding protein